MATAAAKAQRRGRARPLLRERLEARRAEIEAATLTRVRAIADPSEISDPAYAEGLRAAVGAAVAYGIETTGRAGADPPIPVALLAQARMAARVGLALDTVLRRYFAGYSLLGYFILEEASRAGLTDGDELKRLLGAHAGIFDRLLAAIGEEHARETERGGPSVGGRQVERIERLLAGEPLDASELEYDFDGWSLGAAASGPGAAEALRELARVVDCRLLLICRERDTAWAWLGSRRALDPGELLRAASALRSRPAAIALGEPAEGIAGWRLTHRQAVAALPLADRGLRQAVRYVDVTLLAAVLQDELLATSLRQLYIEPLETGPHGGAALLETLRAYLLADGNVTSTAAVLSVNRGTVAYRLQAIEDRIGRPLGSCAAELRVAVDFAGLGEPSRSSASPANR